MHAARGGMLRRQSLAAQSRPYQAWQCATVRRAPLGLALCRHARLQCGASTAAALPLEPGGLRPAAAGTNDSRNGNGIDHSNGNGRGSLVKGEAHQQQQRQQGLPPKRARTSTLAEALAAPFPAVKPLPPVPTSGTLQDVIPYLLTLALQEAKLWWRVAAAVACMVVAKVAGINVPLFSKEAVDCLAAASGPESMAFRQAALKAVLTYGFLECIKTVNKELQGPVFAPVTQAVTRRVAYHTFSHMLALDTRFHLDRRTGRVSRILERGNRAISVMYRALIFFFLPTFLELAFVAALLASRFGPELAVLLGGTFAGYVAWTIFMTQKATEVRKKANELDNLTSSKAVDALLIYETVTLFGNQRLEVSMYDKHLRDYQGTALLNERLAAGLNIGQGLSLSAGQTAVLALIVLRSGMFGAAAAGGAGGVIAGGVSGGDLVLASGLITQLWAPLQFLGWLYKELREALVDMEDFFGILRTPSGIKDGTRSLPPAPLPAPAASAPSLAPAAASTPESATTSAPSPAPAPAARVSPVPSPSLAAEAARQEERHGDPAQGAGQGQAPEQAQAESHGQVQGRGLEVELVDVSFGYSHDRQILKGVSLRVRPGESVAVVGSSGSGKSTILKLVTRLYDVWHDNPAGAGAGAAAAAASNGAGSNRHGCSNGNGNGNGNGSGRACAACNGNGGAGGSSELRTHCVAAPSNGVHAAGHGAAVNGQPPRPPGVYVNGVDVRELRLEELRSAIAVVPQDTVLAYDSIRENIRYGRPDASDEEVEAAARMARLHDTVMSLPDKYDTVVGERGLKLSGGEKQRVAIARAFLRSPRLLICDEATSALDSATEAGIMESLGELATGRSALFVAHRLSTVRQCDRIVVLQGGVVVEEGSHEQLMARRGEYAAMWELQAHQG